jgi:hypothetical protein
LHLLDFVPERRNCSRKHDAAVVEVGARDWQKVAEKAWGGLNCFLREAG